MLAFARDVQVIASMTSGVPPETTVDRVLRLRGHGMTGLAGALRAAHRQVGQARAARRVVVLLSDCRATDEQDAVPAASALPELIVLAPADDHQEADRLARASGARCVVLAGASSAPGLLRDLLG